MKSNPNYFELWSIKVRLTLLEANIFVVVAVVFVVVDVVVNVVVMALLHIRSCVVCKDKSNYSCK